MSIAPLAGLARAVGEIPIEKLREYSGIELFRAMMAGELPSAPIAATLGFWLQEAEPGRVVFAAVPEKRHYNPIGSVHGGFAATLLDSAMSCAVHSQLAKGFGYTTLEFKINLVRPITDKTGPITCEGKSLAVGKRIGTSEGRIIDAAGKLYAHGTATCLIFEI
ncbi:MAG: PaaI family thioesterase [Alphaproteobacteria bacterium]|nr:PaaI family thioesterase [Alphaproteobacteria bacterium]